MSKWDCVLKLNSKRSIVSGSYKSLCNAIKKGADLRIGTEFKHNEHVDIHSSNPEVVKETAEFRITYLLNDCWTAGIMSLRQPISLPDKFGNRSSMSFFLYNQNGQQAIARPYLDKKISKRTDITSNINDVTKMPKYHELENWDSETNAPSINFIYDFDYYNFWIKDEWHEVLSHNSEGVIQSGSIDKLVNAFKDGCSVKVGIFNLCDELQPSHKKPIHHEVFVELNSCYYYTSNKLFIGATQPIIRVRPNIPLLYKSLSWDFGWLIVRTDGLTVKRLCNPRNLEFKDTKSHYHIRWFIK